MKTITIKQPWASLISNGYKKYEFRSWKASYRGELLIHAGKGIDKKAMEKFKYLNLEYPKSKIVAKVILTDCIDLSMNKIKEDNFNAYENTQTGYAWGIKLIEKIESSKEVNGKLSFWDYN